MRNLIGKIVGIGALLFILTSAVTFGDEWNGTISGKLFYLNGNVGIGTETPGYKADVNGTIKTNGDVYIAKGGNGRLWIGRQHEQEGSVEGAEIVMEGAPNYPFFLLDNFKYTSRLFWAGETEDTQFQIFNTGTGKANMYLEGNLGLGTSTPIHKLDIVGGIGMTPNNAISWNTYYSGGWKYAANGSAGFIKLTNNSDLDFYTAAVNAGGAGAAANPALRMRITNDGFMGIGTSTPTNLLHLNGAHAQLRIKNTTSTRSWDVAVTGSGWASPVDTFVIMPDNVGSSLNAPFAITSSGHIGMGTVNPGDYRLAVNGKIRATEIKVDTGWADFVFEDDYELRSLSEVESFIEENGHLPEIPSAEEVEAEGVSLGEMDSKLLQKIEELTLYMIEMEKRNARLEEEVAALKAERE